MGTKALRCPMCGILSTAGTRTCECGHAFDADHGPTPELLKTQVRRGRAMVAGGIAVVMVSAGLVFVAWPITLVLTGPGYAMMRKGSRIASAAQHGLDELAARNAALPAARIVDR